MNLLTPHSDNLILRKSNNILMSYIYQNNVRKKNLVTVPDFLRDQYYLK